jgi:hypothetical protein
MDFSEALKAVKEGKAVSLDDSDVALRLYEKDGCTEITWVEKLDIDRYVGDLRDISLDDYALMAEHWEVVE